MPFRYVPLLRSKAGEAVALDHLSPQAQARIFPIVHVVESPPPAFPNRLVQAWNGRRMALDGLFNFNATGGPNTFANMFNTLGQGGIEVIPSVECLAPAAYAAAVQPLVGRYAPGIVVKTTLRYLPQVAAWIGQYGWNPGDIDLVIESGEVTAFDTNDFALYVVHAINASIPQPVAWRSVTLASSAAPVHLGGYPVGRSDIPRVDWQIWQATAPQLHFQLDYGDYAQLHPDLTDPPGVAMARAPVSVRYTTDNHWIILKGRPVSGPNGVQMGVQYHGHATALRNDPQFGGVAGCWRDQRIQQIVGRAISPGNRAGWATVLVNRHMALVADRLP